LADIVEKLAAVTSPDAPSESNSPQDANRPSKIELRFRNAGAHLIAATIILTIGLILGYRPEPGIHGTTLREIARAIISGSPEERPLAKGTKITL
jgi:hypothetical protein